MSCVVAIEHEGAVLVGYDSATSDDSGAQWITSDPKAWIAGSAILGAVGDAWLFAALRHDATLTKAKPGKDVEHWILRTLSPRIEKLIGKRKRPNVEVLVAAQGVVWTFDVSTMGTMRTADGFTAIGTGAPPALGSLYSTRGRTPKIRMRLALEAAARYTTTVSAPFKFLKI